jgi:hypothetical protein
LDDTREIREILPDEYIVSDVYHYEYRSFMDTWDLYRFSTTPAAIDFLKSKLNLEFQGIVHNYPLIISKPPAYWWDPEQEVEAELYQSSQRAADERLYELLYSQSSGIAYLIRFDG